VIAALLHWPFASEHLSDRRSQRFGSINDEQILAVCGKPLIPKVGQQAQDRIGASRRLPTFNLSQDILT
jgi:hypothetical protein